MRSALVPNSVSLTLAIKVTPRANADAVVGWCDDARNELLIRVTATPEDGKANAMVVKTLAQSLAIPKSTIRITRGHASRRKLVAFEIDQERYRQWQNALPVQQ
ncbi:MAG: DUF167 domain-containing protein [Coriobacteriales bacterium]|nr:DUF167 domain-containing protein [Coriobacteriales bacterium]